MAWLALGVLPFVAAFVFVELAAAVLPRLRGMRRGSAHERWPLTAAAWILGASLTTWQAWGLAVRLQRLRGTLGFPLIDPGVAPVLAVAAALLLGGLALGGMAVLVSRYGLGNGFAVLMATSAVERSVYLGRFALDQPRAMWKDETLLLGLVLVVLVPLVVAHVRKHGPGIGPLVSVPTCGLVAVRGPYLAVHFVSKLAVWLTALTPLAETLESDTTWWGTLGDLAATAAVAFLLTRLFCPTAEVVGAWGRAAPGRVDASVVRRALAVTDTGFSVPARGWLVPRICGRKPPRRRRTAAPVQHRTAVPGRPRATAVRLKGEAVG
jgi:hypothetical protein